jgi:tRNA dimethylallyltransferase
MTPSRADPDERVPARRFLVGATATGKTAVALELARRLREPASVEWISLDSMLVYRGLDIVTAKPSAAERAHCVLHGLDLAAPGEGFSVARFSAFARDCERQVLDRGRIPVFVGGTGLYLKALTHGLFDGPGADARLRAELEARAEREGAGALHAELTRVDPDAAARIHPRDRKRAIRALEVYAATGVPISAHQREWRGGSPAAHRIVALGIDKGELHGRIAARVDRMFDLGVVDEVRRARDAGLSREARLAVGIPEILAYLDGAMAEAECRAAIALHTRQLARRQATWFRRFPEIQWIEAGGGRPIEEVARDVGRALGLEL